MNIDIYELAEQTSKKYSWISKDALYKVLQQIAWTGTIEHEELIQLNEIIYGGRK